MPNGLMLTAARTKAMTAPGWWQDRTIVDFLEANLARCPDRPFIKARSSVTDLQVTLTFRELDQLSRRIGAGLAAKGVDAGDVVGVQLPNWWEFAAIHIACVRIGAITNPLMPIFREHELRFMLDFAETRVLIIPRVFRGFEYPPMVEILRTDLPKLEHVFVVDGAGPDSFERNFLDHEWESEPGVHALFAERRVAPNDVIHYCYTSGTSGQPKAVMHTYNTLVGSTGGATALELDDTLVVLMGSPLAHQTGFLFGLLMPMMLGGRTVLMDIWSADEAARLIAEQSVTLTMGATPFLADLTDCAMLEQHPPDSLEFFISAGAPIPRPLIQRAHERLGAQIVAGWGMSENGLVTSTRRGDDESKILETDGKPWAGMELRIVNEEGVAIPNGQEGRLQCRGAANFVGYLKRPEAYEVDTDEWFETGDNARLDADGYVTITGRAKDIIIRGGENIPVANVESVIYKHPAVREIAIVAMPDPRLGERACLFVALHDGHELSLDSLKEYLEVSGLARQYWPERVEVMQDMPRTASGKIQKFRLRELAASYAV
jgi:cyclohexanecarboxylate-CoA ligase